MEIQLDNVLVYILRQSICRDSGRLFFYVCVLLIFCCDFLQCTFENDIKLNAKIRGLSVLPVQ